MVKKKGYMCETCSSSFKKTMDHQQTPNFTDRIFLFFVFVFFFILLWGGGVKEEWLREAGLHNKGDLLQGANPDFHKGGGLPAKIVEIQGRNLFFFFSHLEQGPPCYRACYQLQYPLKWVIYWIWT